MAHELLTSVESLQSRDLLGIKDISKQEALALLELAARLKEGTRAGAERLHWDNLRILAMIFEKPSLRTRFTFETAMVQLGGHAVYLSPAEIGLGKRESVADIARNLERWCHVVMGRVFAHDSLVGLAQWGDKPVINALCDQEHPCQALADFLALREAKGHLEGLKMAYVGDGNNVAHSLMLLAGHTGVNITVACPAGYEPSVKYVEIARTFADASGSNVEIVNDPYAAVEGADAVYTDVWASMGQEAETAKREQDFKGFQVNSTLMSAAKPDAVAMHCLPAHRGSEITDDVMDSAQSIVFDQAENRLHAQKAVIAALVGGF
ncbi:MAG: ornithine carbamoyltransferase [Armatimonadota bacterium]